MDVQAQWVQEVVEEQQQEVELVLVLVFQEGQELVLACS